MDYIFYSLNEDVRVRRTIGNVGHFVCKIADTQLVYDFQALNRGPNPVHVIFSFVSTYPYVCARVGNFATVYTYPQIVDHPRLQCCPRSECGVSEYVLIRRCLQTHTHTLAIFYTKLWGYYLFVLSKFSHIKWDFYPRKAHFTWGGVNLTNPCDLSCKYPIAKSSSCTDVHTHMYT